VGHRLERRQDASRRGQWLARWGDQTAAANSTMMTRRRVRALQVVGGPATTPEERPSCSATTRARVVEWQTRGTQKPIRELIHNDLRAFGPAGGASDFNSSSASCSRVGRFFPYTFSTSITFFSAGLSAMTGGSNPLSSRLSPARKLGLADSPKRAVLDDQQPISQAARAHPVQRGQQEPRGAWVRSAALGLPLP